MVTQTVDSVSDGVSSDRHFHTHKPTYVLSTLQNIPLSIGTARLRVGSETHDPTVTTSGPSGTTDGTGISRIVLSLDSVK